VPQVERPKQTHAALAAFLSEAPDAPPSPRSREDR
jgi:hypothetical protein